MRAIMTFRFSGLAMPCLALAMALAGGSKPAHAQQVQRVVSSNAGDRLSPAASLAFKKASGGAAPRFRIDDRTKFQTIIGFGASFSEAGMISLNSLPSERQDEVLRAIFDPAKGAGFSAMATWVGPNDMASADGYYTYDDSHDDVELKKFSIDRDLKPTGMMTFIKRARRFGSFTLQSKMNYPPEWMMLNPEFGQGQIIKPAYYGILAQYLAKYVKAYEQEGVSIDYLSLFNEPGLFVKAGALDIATIMNNHVAPQFRSAGLRTKLLIGDAPFRQWAVEQYPLVLDDPALSKNIAGIGYHAYDWLFSPKLDDAASVKGIAELHRKYPQLVLWMTETCYAASMANVLGKKPLPRYDFEDGDFWGRQIAGELMAGASAWTYWNTILDENGGPWLESEKHFFRGGNHQQPVVVVNRKTGAVSYTGLYYYLAHFSKYVRPGSVRVAVEGQTADVRLLAFERPDGKVVLQAINSATSSASTSVGWRGSMLDMTLPATSISTFIWDAGARG